MPCELCEYWALVMETLVFTNPIADPQQAPNPVTLLCVSSMLNSQLSLKTALFDHLVKR